MELNWYKTSQQDLTDLSTLFFRPECTGAHHGQIDCNIKAYLKQPEAYSQYMGDRLVGYLSYTEFQGKTYIKHIEVAEDMRRNGIATQLYQELQKEAQGEIQHTMTTSEGSAWVDSLE